MGFGRGINADSVQLGRDGDDLMLDMSSTDRVVLKNYFSSAGYRIESIAFADGTSWDMAAVMARLTYNGTAGADYMTAVPGYANRINGLDGNDRIYGADKDDVLSGGAGNDVLDGGRGNDTFLFNLGDGVDTISDYDATGSSLDTLRFGSGITADSVQLGRDGDDLMLDVSRTDRVVLKNYFSSAQYRIESIAFADGTSWDMAAVMARLSYNGTAGPTPCRWCRVMPTGSTGWTATTRLSARTKRIYCLVA